MLLDELRQRNFHIANPGKQEAKPVAAEEPVREQDSNSDIPQAESGQPEKKEMAGDTENESVQSTAAEDDGEGNDS